MKFEPDMVAFPHDEANHLVEHARELSTQENRSEEIEHLLEQAYVYYQQARSEMPENADILRNWADALSFHASRQDAEESIDLYEQAREKYALAHSIKPDDYEILGNWANCVLHLAMRSEPAEGWDLHLEADRLFRQTTDYGEAYAPYLLNHGYNCGCLAEQSKSFEESERWYEEAYRCFERALALRPGYEEALQSWGHTLCQSATHYEGPQAAQLYYEGAEKFAEALELVFDNSRLYLQHAKALIASCNFASTEDIVSRTALALRQLKLAQRFDPNEDEIPFQVGNAHFTRMRVLGDAAEAASSREAARQAYLEASERDPQNIPSLHNWAKLEATPAADSGDEQALERLALARPLFERLIATFPDWPGPRYNLALAILTATDEVSPEAELALHQEIRDIATKILLDHPGEREAMGLLARTELRLAEVYLPENRQEGEEALRRSKEIYHSMLGPEDRDSDFASQWGFLVYRIAEEQPPELAQPLLVDAEAAFERAITDAQGIDAAEFTTLGLVRHSLALLRSGNEQRDTFVRSHDAFTEADRRSPNESMILSAWGLMLLNYCDTLEGRQREEVLSLGMSKLEQVEKLDPSIYFLAAFGERLIDLAESNPLLAEFYYGLAREKLQRAQEMSPEDSKLDYLLGLCTFNLARTQPKDQREELLAATDQHFRRALAALPEEARYLEVLGNTCWFRSTLCSGEEARKLQQEALECYTQALEHDRHDRREMLEEKIDELREDMREEAEDSKPRFSWDLSLRNRRLRGWLIVLGLWLVFKLVIRLLKYSGQ